MDQTVHSGRHREYEAVAPGDLRGLLAMLDHADEVAPLDDGMHRLVTSIAALRRTTEHRG